MTAVPDRRQTKTRAALHNSFRSLLLGQGYDALTVGAVADTANVGRSTFYEHYRTMDDLLRESIQGPFTTLADLVDRPAAGDALVNLLLHFRENQQVARVLLGWPTRPVLASALAQLIADRLRASPLAAPLIPAEVIARQIAEMQLVLIDAWIAGRPAMQAEAVANALGAGTGALMSVLAGRVR
jgi:AcrR family transcriptional regulator